MCKQRERLFFFFKIAEHYCFLLIGSDDPPKCCRRKLQWYARLFKVFFFVSSFLFQVEQPYSWGATVMSALVVDFRSTERNFHGDLVAITWSPLATTDVWVMKISKISEKEKFPTERGANSLAPRLALKLVPC